MKNVIIKLSVILLATVLLYVMFSSEHSMNIAHRKDVIQHKKPGAKFENGVFHNTTVDWNVDFARMWKAFSTPKHLLSFPDRDLPQTQIPASDLTIKGVDRLYRLGHSTVLMELDGNWIITDPVFVRRASPVQWLGPERFDETPISITELPKLKAVIISHNHYDHLSQSSIEQLIDKTENFIVPLKLGALLHEWGVPLNKIIELDWWQGIALDGLTINATPAQHYSRRSLWDTNKSLWASYVIETKDLRIFFSGDSGYSKDFAQIGQYFGSFDIALLEVGAYNELWREIHMLPQDAAQASIDLNTKIVVPIHNGTFDLGKHAWWEPFEAIKTLGIERGIKVLLPMFGEQVLIKEPQNTIDWWKELIPTENNK